MVSSNDYLKTVVDLEIMSHERSIVIEWAQMVAAIIRGLIAILAWVAMVRWAEEYYKAKEEIIRVKDIQPAILQREINSFTNLAPLKTRKYFSNVKSQLEDYIEFLKGNLMKALVENDELDAQGESFG